MEAPVVGAVPSGGGDAGGGGAQQPQLVPESRSGRARPGDFASRVESLNSDEGIGGFGGFGSNSEQRLARRSAEEDPSVTEKALQADASDSLENYEEDPLAQPEEGAVEGEYSDPVDVAKAEFMSKLEGFLAQGRLPTDMLGELLIEKQLPGGQKIDITLSELDRGYMRQGDYTRRLQSAQQLEARANHILQLEAARNQSWRNEDVMFRDIVNMGLLDALDRLVVRYATEQVKFRALPPEERHRIQLQRQADQQRLQYEQRIAQLEQKLQAPQVDTQVQEATRHFQAQLSQMLPSAFKKYGLRVYPESKKNFLDNIQALYEGGPCTRELVDAAAQATREQLEQHALLAAEAARQRPRQQPGGLRPRPLSGGVGPGVQNAQGNGKRRRPSDFNHRFNSNGI